MAAVGAKSVPPTLLSLCLQAVAAHLTADAAGAGRSGGCGAHFDGLVQEHEEEDGGHLTPEQVAEALPWELLHQLASSLPPFALELLHHGAHARYPTPLPVLPPPMDHGCSLSSSICEIQCSVFYSF